MSNEVMAALIGSGLFGAVGSMAMAFVRARSDAKSADTHTLEVVHSVYDETLDTMMARMARLEITVASLEVSNGRLRNRVSQLEQFIIQSGLSLPANLTD